MPFKVSLIFTGTTGIDPNRSLLRRTAGWTESWYHLVAGNVTTLESFTATLANRRAALLPEGFRISAYRFQNVTPPGPSALRNANIPGVIGNSCDQPKAGLLIAVPSSSSVKVSRYILRGIPDNQIEQGEFAPTPAFAISLSAFFDEINAGGWGIRVRSVGETSYDIVDITNSVVTTILPHGITAGSVVSITRTKDDNGQVVGSGSYKVTTPITSTTFKLLGWPIAAQTVGGQALARVYTYEDAARPVESRITTRNVGSPFVKFRGRRSRRS